MKDMYAARHLSVESISQSVLFIGESGPLITGLAKLLNAKGFLTYLLSVGEGDLRNTPKLLKPLTLKQVSTLISESPPDYLYLVGSNALIPWLNYKSNLAKIRELLELAERNSSKLISVSSPADLPQEVLADISHKRIEYSGLYGVGVVEPSSLLSMFQEAVTSQIITLHEEGLQPLHLTHLDDLLDGIIQATLYPYLLEHPFQLINPDSVSALNLAHRLIPLFPYKINLLFSKEPSSLPEVNWSKLNSLYEKISWHPSAKLSHHLKRVVDWYLSTFPSESLSEPPLVAKPKLLATTPRTSSPKRTNHLTPLTKNTSPKVKLPAKKSSKMNLLAKLFPAKSASTPQFIKLKPPIKHPKRKKLKLTFPKFPSLKLPQGRGFFFSFTLALVFYFLSLAFSALILGFSTRSLFTKLTARNLNLAPTTSLVRYSNLYLHANLSFASELPLLRNSQKIRESLNLSSVLTRSLSALDTGLTLTTSAERISHHILDEADYDISSELSHTKTQLDSLYEDLSLISGSLSSDPPSVIPTKYAASYQRLLDSLTKSRHLVLSAKTILTSFPEVLGVGEQRKYAVLLQNNMELRPTGGFIGSFAIAEFEDAKLFDLQVYDVYSADGQLKGHVEPPEPIKEHLGEANWYLRDSNWDPDFPTSARRAEWFIDKTIQEKVDGVIALNLTTIKQILNATGPINLPDYDEEITANNLFERAEYHSEINFFPGSTQKKEFLAALTNQLFSQASSFTEAQQLALALELYNSFMSKDLLVSFSDQSLDSIYSQLAWNGEIKNPPCSSLTGDSADQCLADYLYVVDSNFGVNKANYFLSRSSSLTSTIHPDRKTLNQLELTYHNSATSDSWPAGTYKNYQRLYLPKGSKLESIKVGGKKLLNSELDISTSNNKTVIGYLFSVPINSEVVVEAEYDLPFSLTSTNPLYSFYWQKQPGTPANEPLDITINYPLYLTPTIISPSADYNDQQVSFTLTNSSDRRISIQFQE